MKSKSMWFVLFVALSAFAAEPTLEPTDPRWRGSEGWQQARWGMKLSEVQKLYPKATLADDGSYMMRTTIAGIPCVAGFIFKQGRLAGVGLMFPVGVGKATKRSDKEVFELLRGLLAKKYGPGLENTESFEDPKPVTWQTSQTLIVLRSMDFRTAAFVVYVNPALHGQKETLPEGAEDDL